MSLSSILSINNTGLNGMQNELDVVSHNIANSGTVGYKGITNSFNELMHNNLLTAQGRTQVTANAGTNGAGSVIDDRTGEIETTGRKLDLAINGSAYFGLRGPDGQTYLTKAGNFHRDASGALIAANGYPVAVNAQVPVTNWPQGTLAIGPDGQISVGNTVVGSLQLFQPNNEHALVAVSDNLYQANGGFNQVTNGSTVIQGALEESNIDLAGQMTEMITAQRAYQMNARAVSATDEMMDTVNHFTD